MQVLTNHVGFAATSAKRAIVQHDVPLQAQPFSVVDLRSRAVVFGGVTTPVAPVAGWRGRHFAPSCSTAPGRRCSRSRSR